MHCSMNHLIQLKYQIKSINRWEKCAVRFLISNHTHTSSSKHSDLMNLDGTPKNRITNNGVCVCDGIHVALMSI